MIRKSATHSFSPSGCWNTMPSTIYLQHVSVKPKLYSQQRQCGELIMPDTSQQRHNDLMPGANQSSDCHDTMPSISPTGHECSTNKWIGLTYRVVQDNAMGYGKKPSITRVQCWTPAGATARYQAFDLQNVRVALMNEFSTHHLGQSRQDNDISIDLILGNPTRRSRKQHTVDGGTVAWSRKP